MTCENFEDLILDDLDGRLARAHKITLADHLAGCSSCRAFLATQVELDQALVQSARPELSPVFAARVERICETRHATAAVPLELLLNCAGVLAVAVAGAVAARQLVPDLVPGIPWAIAAFIVSAGAVVIAESESASSS